MSPQLIALLVALVHEAPALTAQILGIWHKQGKLTAEEIAAFISEQWPEASSFFKPTPEPQPPVMP